MPAPTYPPCTACDAHEKLEDDMKEYKDRNTFEHSAIMSSLENLGSDVRWMSLIGKWILGSLLGYFIALGYYILSNDYATHEDVDKAVTEIKKDIK